MGYRMEEPCGRSGAGARASEPRTDGQRSLCSGVCDASGVAPAAKSKCPIRLISLFGAQHLADATACAAGNGADVIWCSWGHDDGVWHNPCDPLRGAIARLPDNTRPSRSTRYRAGLESPMHRRGVGVDVRRR